MLDFNKRYGYGLKQTHINPKNYQLFNKRFERISLKYQPFVFHLPGNNIFLNKARAADYFFGTFEKYIYEKLSLTQNVLYNASDDYAWFEDHKTI